MTHEISGAIVFDKETLQNKPANLQDALTYLNEFLAFDGYEIVHAKATMSWTKRAARLPPAESAECIGGQLGRLGDLSGSLRAALPVDHLIAKYPQVFANIPRWQNERVPADLATIVVQGLNKVSEDKSSYRGLDEVQKAFTNFLPSIGLRSSTPQPKMPSDFVN